MSLAVTLVALIVALPCAYLGVLGVLALLPPRSDARSVGSRSFCIIVPAHNETTRIAACVRSILEQQGQHRVDVVVVADNCTDDTAALAASAGARVVERHNTVEVGKGYALAKGLEYVPAEADCVGFVDGDCIVGEGALDVVSAALAGGARVVQCRYEMTGRERSATASIRAFALALVHVVRPLAKDRIAASAGLKGSGMFFGRAVIEAIGWNAHGLAEDIEQHVALLEAGHRVTYRHDALVIGDAPARLADARTQHERWEAGRASAARRFGLPLLATGLRRGSLAMVDAGIELLLPPLSVIGGGLLVVTALAAIAGGQVAVLVAGAAWAGLIIYLLSGILRSGLSATELAQAVFFAPVFAVWKMGVYGRALVRRPRSWNPTRRN